MEVDFNVALISHPTEFEGTSWVVDNFGVATSRLTNVLVCAKTTVLPIDFNVVVFFDVLVNTDSEVLMVLPSTSNAPKNVGLTIEAVDIVKAIVMDG
jgi:hypothetical protein